MIGNDIVDLSFSRRNSNWKRPGYLCKLFSREEQQLILSDDNQEAMLWRLWSMKESAYKAHQRKFNLPPCFNPLALRCTAHPSGTGQVTIEREKYLTHTKVTGQFIYSDVKAVAEKTGLVSEIKEHSSGKNLRTEILQFLSGHLKQYRLSDLRIEKCSNRIPRIFHGESELKIPFSLTHHGLYSAFVIKELPIS